MLGVGRLPLTRALAGPFPLRSTPQCIQRTQRLPRLAFAACSAAHACVLSQLVIAALRCNHAVQRGLTASEWLLSHRRRRDRTAGTTRGACARRPPPPACTTRRAPARSESHPVRLVGGLASAASAMGILRWAAMGRGYCHCIGNSGALYVAMHSTQPFIALSIGFSEHRSCVQSPQAAVKRRAVRRAAERWWHRRH